MKTTRDINEIIKELLEHPEYVGGSIFTVEDFVNWANDNNDGDCEDITVEDIAHDSDVKQAMVDSIDRLNEYTFSSDVMPYIKLWKSNGEVNVVENL